jgi:hypothetical protein
LLAMDPLRQLPFFSKLSITRIQLILTIVSFTLRGCKYL